MDLIDEVKQMAKIINLGLRKYYDDQFKKIRENLLESVEELIEDRPIELLEKYSASKYSKLRKPILTQALGALRYSAHHTKPAISFETFVNAQEIIVGLLAKSTKQVGEQNASSVSHKPSVLGKNSLPVQNEEADRAARVYGRFVDWIDTELERLAPNRKSDGSRERDFEAWEQLVPEEGAPSISTLEKRFLLSINLFAAQEGYVHPVAFPCSECGRISIDVKYEAEFHSCAQCIAEHREMEMDDGDDGFDGNYSGTMWE